MRWKYSQLIGSSKLASWVPASALLSEDLEKYNEMAIQKAMSLVGV